MATFNKIFTNQTANASTAAQDWDGRKGQVVANGTWDTSNLQLEMSPDDGTTWISVGDEGKLTDSGAFTFDLNPCKVRLTLASVGSSTSINAWISKDNTGSNKINSKDPT